ncbi:hypothetical protein ADUPG1_010939 [Aduncisulcus paluster]|uniref:Uncharacterized protein n=1 Tax=Aduncisulcus paluster TaxID=2918883 RepID=A0ABQ5JTI3_9EUKA|nr:hypothetical protein ADUPG1_010939 [Aduncisulcus paluster]
MPFFSLFTSEIQFTSCRFFVPIKLFTSLTNHYSGYFCAKLQILFLSIFITSIFNSKNTKMSSSTPTIPEECLCTQIVIPEFLHEGECACNPISRDAPNVINPDFPAIEAEDETKEEAASRQLVEHWQCFVAQDMMRGEYYDGPYTHVSIPFPSSSPIKGVYICLSRYSPPSHLIFTFTLAREEVISKKYEFPEICLLKDEYPDVEGGIWYYLPVDLSDVVLCEITGKGKETEHFRIINPTFIREETPEEILIREVKEKLWFDLQTQVPEFVKKGDEESGGRASIPIPRDDPSIISPSFPLVVSIDDSLYKTSGWYDTSIQARDMLKVGHDVLLSHLSIPFPSPSPMKGAYICVYKNHSSPSLLFTFTDSDGKKISKKYEFPEPEFTFAWFFLPIDLDNVVLCEIEGKGISPSLLFTFTDSDGKKISKKYEFPEPEFTFAWFFLPIDLDNVVLCEIEGKGMWENKKCRNFVISSLVFTMPEERIGSEPLSCLPFEHSIDDNYHHDNETRIESKEGRKDEEEEKGMVVSLDIIFFGGKNKLKSQTIFQMNSSTDDVSHFVNHAITESRKAEFLYEGNSCVELLMVLATDITQEGDGSYDQSFTAQVMMQGDDIGGQFTHLSIPFSSSSPMKGAYICLSGYSGKPPPSQLIFTFTSLKGEKISKLYDFPEFIGTHWYFLPVDLSDIVLCEITRKGRVKDERFVLSSLIFFRDETLEETISREAREKLWSEAPVVKPKFVKEGNYEAPGRYSPIPRDDPKLLNPLYSMVKCKDDSFCKEYEDYDKSLKAQEMLKGKGFTPLSQLFIPFPSPSSMKGAFICVNKHVSSPSLLFTFTDCDGKKISKKYEFIRLKHSFEWHFLPIDLDDVVLCEIEGKGMWDQKYSRSFNIYSLVFTAIPEKIIAERLSQLPWK